MIHHISIDANNPLQVASVLAEILQGKTYQFLVSDSYAVLPFDSYGTHIVVFKAGDVWVPGADAESAHVRPAAPSNFVAIHAAMSVPTTQLQLEAIGQREGWRVLHRPSGNTPFGVIEFWVENRILFEFLPPGFASHYLQTMQPEMIEQILGQPLQPVSV